MVIRGAIGSIVSLSSNDGNGRLPGAICGDFACMYVSTPSIAIIIAIKVGTKYGDRIKSVTWYLTPDGVKDTSGSWKAYSYVQTGVSTWVSNWFGSFTSTASFKYGDFMITHGSGYAPSLACRNLWIDTSKPI